MKSWGFQQPRPTGSIARVSGLLKNLMCENIVISTVVPTSNTRRDEVERSVLRRMISGNRFLHYV
ncbi:MAG: hypothetical protein ABIG42_00100, partial [bacterium]